MVDDNDRHPEPESSDADEVGEPLPAESAPTPVIPETVETREPTEIPWRLGAFLLLAVLVVVFAVQNTQDAQLRFLAWEWQLPLVIIILITVVVSVLLDQILGGMVKRRRRRQRRERDELKRLRDLT